MRKKHIDIIVFVLSSLALLISVKLFWNMGIYVDEYNTTPAVVNGGEFWLLMDWLRIFILGALSILSLIRLFRKEK